MESARGRILYAVREEEVDEGDLVIEQSCVTPVKQFSAFGVYRDEEGRVYRLRRTRTVEMNGGQKPELTVAFDYHIPPVNQKTEADRQAKNSAYVKKITPARDPEPGEVLALSAKKLETVELQVTLVIAGKWTFNKDSNITERDAPYRGYIEGVVLTNGISLVDELDKYFEGKRQKYYV